MIQLNPMDDILLVEDAAELAQIVRQELQTAGYEVRWAADGLTALEMFEQRRPALVILDWMLPRLDGLEVLRRMRQKAPTPVLMLTARSEEVDRVIGLEVGADDYLTKPFGMRELLARVRAMLRRVELMQNTLLEDRRKSDGVVVCGALELDPEAYRTQVNGQPVDLTRTEFDLLLLLVRCPGRVFNRAYLLDTVWGENYVTGDRSVDNAVLRLRKKLGSLGEAIETVFGIGYRFNPPR